MECTFHPQTETLLRCSKCDRPICGKCAVTTPVGARCPECANVQRLPTYSLPAPQFGVSVAVALGAGIGTGVVLGLVRVTGALDILGSLYVPLGFIAAGYLIGEAISRASNRKRATPLQVLAAFSYGTSIIAFSQVAELPSVSHPLTLVGLVVGAAMAVNPFR
ncbi:MAG: hypothetical protein OXK21_05870 [Chloroflexota bacterium]|nr:hypothetical protein [Chloroflexota bacterium]